MIVLVQANLLSIGLNGENEVLEKLPIRLIPFKSGAEAARSLKTEKIDGVISRWDLEDMKDGWFLRRFRVIKPNVPTIVFVRSGDNAQEIAARSIGVSAVLTDETPDGLICQTVASILGLTFTTPARTTSRATKRRSRRRITLK